MNQTASEPMGEQITVRMTEAEKKKASALAKYLFAKGKLDEPSVAGVMRLSLIFLVNECARDVEAERLGAK